MRHVILTCKNHPDLRWSCKSIAYTEGYGYNGQRNIFYNGSLVRNDDGSPSMYPDGSGVNAKLTVAECPCSPRDLVLAPEDALVAERYGE